MSVPKQHRRRIATTEYERHEARRGCRYAYPQLRPEHFALVVIDMVPFSVDGKPPALGVVDTLNRLTCGFRAAGGRVAWMVPSPDTDDELNATLHTIYRSFGDVRHTDDVLAAIESL